MATLMSQPLQRRVSPQPVKPADDFDRQLSASTCATVTDDAICTICFEPGPFVTLPCRCTLHYCSGCWDRALAASVATRGKAQCPSCRSAFRVDYDPTQKGLIFSEETETANLSDWRMRIYEKVGPAQISLLHEFGQSCSAPDMETGLGDSVAVAEKSMVQASLPGTSSAEFKKGPSCMCGGELERLDWRSRVVRMLDDTTPEWRSHGHDPDKFVEKLMTSINCDLCGENSTRTGFGWTCSSGPHTLLHPAAYDICEPCFHQHCGLQQAMSLDVASKPPSSPQNGQKTTRSRTFLSSAMEGFRAIRRTRASDHVTHVQTQYY
jgi:hypothetical protein